MEFPDKSNLYPFLFEPFYKTVVWGGHKIADLLKRPLPDDIGPIGEAWDLCDRPGMESCVINGPLAGATIHQLLDVYGTDFAGSHFTGGRFPLLVKIIDADKNLSMQVHPTESYAAACPQFCEAKTEMWYILHSSPDSKIYVGLTRGTTKQQFMDHLNTPMIEKDVQCFDAIPGDAYFVNAGRLHMIGQGNLLLEISQNSATTFRVYDWGRVDANGNGRELHLEQAVGCMDFTDRTVARISGASDETAHNRKYPIINHCPYFRCDDLKLVDCWRDTTSATGSCHLLTPITDSIVVENEKYSTEVVPGSTVLVPACFGRYIIRVKPGRTSTVIRTTI